ncbi:MAG: hypothetical protein KGR98_11985 [Verrucomicrobia bacterium]|nr:hypothetical protein [Verrucomicrobiota bacterium]MDE3097932.1 hypothetical protein [Verrucomicrobiota bacterium]
MTVVKKTQADRLVLKVAVIYNDFSLAGRALAALDRVAADLDDIIAWDAKPWSLGILQNPAQAGVALAVAADARLLLLVLNNLETIPPELLDWLDHWSANRTIREAAIMAVRFDEAQTPPGFWNQIKWLAKWRGLEFLDQRAETAGRLNQPGSDASPSRIRRGMVLVEG